jgi:lipopolysaccharide transport system ATP-binding protein
VEQGSTFGIVGHNGAGKSTLLKILSRVTSPTGGGVDLNGRVGALLEVGTGFHGELTGAENVYLNGALLGMQRSEVARQFDEIVAFAEVEDFIYTPVKRYSSGMYLRLAFAVAAHLEPEILIVDEVLSVGDLAFQEKCLGRMQTVAGDGRTVLFVSHNLAAVSKLCQRSILLSNGAKVAEGPTEDVIDEYLRMVRTGGSVRLDQRDDREGSGRLRFSELRYEVNGVASDTVRTGDDLTIVLGYETAGRPVRNASFSVSVTTLLSELMLHFDSRMVGTTFAHLPPSGELRLRVPRLPLPAGTYTVSMASEGGGELLDLVGRAADLVVAGGDFYGSGRTLGDSHRSVLADFSWEAVS